MVPGSQLLQALLPVLLAQLLHVREVRVQSQCPLCKPSMQLAGSNTHVHHVNWHADLHRPRVHPSALAGAIPSGLGAPVRLAALYQARCAPDCMNQPHPVGSSSRNQAHCPSTIRTRVPAPAV